MGIHHLGMSANGAQKYAFLDDMDWLNMAGAINHGRSACLILQEKIVFDTHASWRRRTHAQCESVGAVSLLRMGSRADPPHLEGSCPGRSLSSTRAS